MWGSSGFGVGTTVVSDLNYFPGYESNPGMFADDTKQMHNVQNIKSDSMLHGNLDTV